MSVTDDLQEKIEETRGDLAKLRKKLDEIEHLEQTLRAANDGLAQAGYNVPPNWQEPDSDSARITWCNPRCIGR